MKIPNKIKINREEDYYTHYIGKTSDGKQFVCMIGATLPTPIPEDWENHKRWYAILHLFDDEGNYLTTQTVFTGLTSDGEDDIIERAREERSNFVESLGEVSYQGVEVCLFSTKVEGSVFGLVDASEPEEDYYCINLLPNGLAFFPPWDGDYDT